MAHDAPHWCLIESDPGVFTELIAQMGCKGVQVEELYSLEKESLAAIACAPQSCFFFCNACAVKRAQLQAGPGPANPSLTISCIMQASAQVWPEPLLVLLLVVCAASAPAAKLPQAALLARAPAVSGLSCSCLPAFLPGLHLPQCNLHDLLRQLQVGCPPSAAGLYCELQALGAPCCRPIFGLIFLFKWRKETDDRPTETDSPDIFFANQVISNACATQAILSVLLNTPDLELGSALTDLKSFTADFPPALRGEAISNSESIRMAHNSFSPPQAIIPEETKHPDEEGDAFHFICYIHRSGHVWELDGLKAGPIKLGACTESDWLEVAGPSIQERIKRYSQEEIRFNLMAVVKDRREQHREKVEQLQQQLASSADTGVPRDEVEHELARARSDLQLEVDRHAGWHEDNLRRKHNWIPFLFTFLRSLAQQDQLKPLISRARSQETQSEQH